MVDRPKYAEGRALLTREINKVARFLKEEGVDEIIVQDGHGSGLNVLWEKLSEDIDVCVTGAVKTRYYPKGIENADGVILLGYHAMAGTMDALLEHTMSSVHYQNVWLNGEKAGEVAIDAGVLGDMGIPVGDYTDENVSTKVVKIIESYTGIVDKFVWRKG